MALALLVNEKTNTNEAISSRLYIDTLLRNVPEIGGLKFAEIPTGLLAIPETYQRPQRGHEKEIAKHWDKKKAGALVTSYREGKLYVIDGQHRLLAADKHFLRRQHNLKESGLVFKTAKHSTPKQNVVVALYIGNNLAPCLLRRHLVRCLNILRRNIVTQPPAHKDANS